MFKKQTNKQNKANKLKNRKAEIMSLKLSRGLVRLVTASGRNSIVKSVSSGLGASGKPTLCSQFHLAAVNRNIINIQVRSG